MCYNGVLRKTKPYRCSAWEHLHFNSDQVYSFKVTLPIVHTYLALLLLRSDLGARLGSDQSTSSNVNAGTVHFIPTTSSIQLTAAG